jgi:o-succinylbenzoate synthase
VRLRVSRHALRLRSPWQTAHGTIATRELLAVELTGEDGVCGYGEAAPLQPYDGVSVERAHEALARYETMLADRDSDRMNGAQLIDACRSVDDLPQALAAIDMALWDRAGRRAGRPVAALLTDEPADTVQVNATVAAGDRRGASEQARAAVQAGYECVKLKVGSGDDAGRVAAVRAAIGPTPALRLDANGAWSVPQAIRAIEALAPAGLELVEEPAHGLHAIREVREGVSTRIAIDETAAEPGALGAGVADAVCLKISRCGGISGLLAAAALVRAAGAEVYLASTLDGPLGVASALHAAAALASRGPLPPCGLATLSVFADLPAPDPLPVSGGRIALPAGPGLGVAPL